MNQRIIAFYLPQYYPTKENDEWWQKGFTEWTNVGRAKPLFRNHYQPKVPSELGYYDLRLPEVREEQASLAKIAGIEGFCYWHYWFNGRRMLDRVFSEVVNSGKPDFPFCLCWANHSWYKKTWDSTKPNILLLEQTYPGENDYKCHFYAMLKAFKDDRYMKVDGKPIFGIFRPIDIPDMRLFINTWNRLAIENGMPGFYFFGFTYEESQINVIKESGFDSVVFDYMLSTLREYQSRRCRKLIWRTRKVLGIPNTFDYRTYSNLLLKQFIDDKTIHPCIIPNFDHSPRSGKRNLIITNSLPKYFGELCRSVFSKIQVKRPEENLVFIKAWNEWGEGNYLEPDLKYGRGYIEQLRDSIKD